MSGSLFVVLESHARCATLYLSGRIGPAEFERAIALCSALPAEVTDLRIDARAMALEEASRHPGLRALVATWRDSRECSPQPAVVTISLHDRAPSETGSGHYPVTRTPPEATLV
jgi:hypothetical protein